MRIVTLDVLVQRSPSVLGPKPPRRTKAGSTRGRARRRAREGSDRGGLSRSTARARDASATISCQRAKSAKVAPKRRRAPSAGARISEAAAGDHEEDERREGAHANVEREREPKWRGRARVCARDAPRGRTRGTLDAAVGPFVKRPAFRAKTDGKKGPIGRAAFDRHRFGTRLMIGAIEANNLSRADLIEGRGADRGVSVNRAKRNRREPRSMLTANARPDSPRGVV